MSIRVLGAEEEDVAEVPRVAMRGVGRARSLAVAAAVVQGAGGAGAELSFLSRGTVYNGPWENPSRSGEAQIPYSRRRRSFYLGT